MYGIGPVIGLLLFIIGAIWMIICAFRTSTAWGCGSLILPLVAPIHALLTLRDNWKPLVIWLIGLLLMLPAAMDDSADESETSRLSSPSAEYTVASFDASQANGLLLNRSC
jgi:hypothetical protein